MKGKGGIDRGSSTQKAPQIKELTSGGKAASEVLR